MALASRWLLVCTVRRLAALEGELHSLARLVGANRSHDSVKRLHTNATDMYAYIPVDDSDNSDGVHAHGRKDQDARAHCPISTLKKKQHVCYTAADATVKRLEIPPKDGILSMSHLLRGHMAPI